MTQRIHIMPQGDPELLAGLREQGAELVGHDEQPEAIIVTGMFKKLNLTEVLEANPQVTWVQLPSAGIELYSEILTRFPDLTWTSAKGSYAKPVGEHALALTLAALRGLKGRALASSWGTEGGISLNGLRCVVVGGGGVAAEIVRLYKAFDTHVTVVRRTAEPVEHADVTVAFEGLDEALKGAEVVALAAAATPTTRHLLNADRLALLAEGAVVANVGRGSLVDQAALVEALTGGTLRGAGLDVTDPEPLPDSDPLWALENCLITPHTANPWQTAQPLLSRRIADNVHRFRAGEPLLGLVDLDVGY